MEMMKKNVRKILGAVLMASLVSTSVSISAFGEETVSENVMEAIEDSKEPETEDSIILESENAVKNDSKENSNEAEEAELTGESDILSKVSNPKWGKNSNGDDRVTWDCVYFGNFWQNDTNGDGVADRSDSKEPIKWRILSVDKETGDALVLSDKNLDARDRESTDSWKYTNMRKWLNGYSDGWTRFDYVFYDEAFSEEEKNVIKTTHLVNKYEGNYGITGGEDTDDKVFLLSVDDVFNREYGFLSSVPYEDECDEDIAKAALNTAYASNMGAFTFKFNNTSDFYKEGVGNGRWSLRTKQKYEDFLLDGEVGYNGSMHLHYGLGISGDHDSKSYNGIRPAMNINLLSSKVSYAGVEESRKEFVEPKITPVPQMINLDELNNPRRTENGLGVTWDCIYFGEYLSDDTNGSDFINKNDDKKPIKWRILSVDKITGDALILSDKIIDAQDVYSDSDGEVNWANSTLRSWFNGYDSSMNADKEDYSAEGKSFYDKVFSIEEKKIIKTTHLNNKTEVDGKIVGGEDTDDKVFALSFEDVTNPVYGFQNNPEIDDSARTTGITDYAYCKGAETVLDEYSDDEISEEDLDAKENGWWWLRSNGIDDRHVMGVRPFGNINPKFRGFNNYLGVRPALYVNLKNYPIAYAGTISSSDLHYYVSDNCAVISKYSGTNDELIIPKEIGGYKVIRIGFHALFGVESLTSVVIPDSVTSVGDAAFVDCANLTSVLIPDSVTSIGDGAFAGCANLTSVLIPDSVTSIGDGAFEYCDNLRYVKLPSNLNCIEASTFDECVNLENFDFPSELRIIGEYAFSHCGLKNIKLPSKLEFIDCRAFRECEQLEKIELPMGIKCIGEGAFEECKKLADVEFPDGLNTISGNAFYGCNGIVNLRIPASVKNVGYDAFGECKRLTNVEIPTGVANIDDSAFEGCINIKNVYLGKNTNACFYEFPENMCFEGSKTEVASYFEDFDEEEMEEIKDHIHYNVSVDDFRNMIKNIVIPELPPEEATPNPVGPQQPVITGVPEPINPKPQQPTATATPTPVIPQPQKINVTSVSKTKVSCVKGDVISISINGIDKSTIDMKGKGGSYNKQTGELTITGKGSIKLFTTDGGKKKNVAVFKCVEPKMKNLKLKTGKSKTIKLKGFTNVVWMSSDEKVAKVSGGTVSAVGAGTATITAYINGHPFTASVTVQAGK